MNKGFIKGFSKRKLTFLASTIFGIAIIFAVTFGLPRTSAQTTYTLTVGKIGGITETAIIKSDGNEINCGVTCTAEFSPSETISLTATTVAGSITVFEEWSGACTGTGTCTVTMDEAKNVSARFSEQAVFEKCTIENPSTWGLRFRLTGNAVNVAGCRTKCLAGGGNGNFSINKLLGWCVCGTDRQPSSTQPATQGCDQTCPVPYSCGGQFGQYASYRVAAPTSATASVSGRVVTNEGRGVPSAFVSLTDPEGNKRVAITNPFGYYRFDEIEAGQSVLLKVVSKNYQFESRVVTTNDDLTEVDFVSEP